VTSGGVIGPIVRSEEETVSAVAATLAAALARAAGARRVVVLVADEPGGDLVPRGVGSARGRGASGALGPSRSAGRILAYSPAPPLPSRHPLARWLRARSVALAGGQGEPAAARAWLREQEAQAALGLRAPGGPLAGAALLAGLGRPARRSSLARLGAEAAARLDAARLRARLAAARLGLERAERLAALGALTASLAHELKNPLSAIRTFAQLLPERYDDPEFRREFAPVALAEVDRAAALLNELLDFARGSARRGQTASGRGATTDTEDVNAILAQMLTLAEAEARRRRIRIAHRLDPALPRLPVDRDRMKQLFLNLLLNAIQAIEGEGGEIVVETAARLDADGPVVAIDVRDTGAGIAPADLPSLFTTFFSRKPRGVGLGLAVCRDIVRAHRGRIEVVSEPGRGTTVSVKLPVALVEAGAEVGGHGSGTAHATPAARSTAGVA
jgi:signal transduction histidine kinase